MTKEELEEILAKHKLWLYDDQNGERANLGGANFYGADLRDADLRDADLRDANLSGANFYGANFYGADLRGAKLCDANLSGADLRNAKGVVTFTSGRHLAFYTPHNKYLKIGCEGHEVDYWLEKYKSIGKDSNYSDQEIKAYGGFIKLCAEVGAHK